LPFIYGVHHWETTSVNTSGNTHTTQTQHHREEVLEFHPQFRFIPFRLSWDQGRGEEFEWESFNRRFDVHSSDPRFSSDVIHPRQMEYLMRSPGYPFEYTPRGTIKVSMPTISIGTITVAQDFLQGFFSRVPLFVWRRLGMSDRPPGLDDLS